MSKVKQFSLVTKKVPEKEGEVKRRKKYLQKMKHLKIIMHKLGG